MARKRRKTVTATNRSAPKKARPRARRTRRSSASAANFLVPLALIAAIVACLGFLAFMGYRTVTASEFFEVRKIDVRGNNRASREAVEAIVRSQTERAGVWNADLRAIKENVERLTFVRSAAVSRVLPDGVRINITERVPRAVVRIDGADFLVDDEASVIAPSTKNESLPPMTGWDPGKSDKSVRDNQARVKMYQKMVEDWKAFDLVRRVKAINLKDLDEPRVIVEDSGREVFIEIGKDDFAKRLQKGIEGIANKGETYEGIKLVGQSLRLIPRSAPKNGN